MRRSLVGSSHLGQKGSGKLEVVMENCWKIVDKIKKEENNGNCWKIGEKERPTNSHSIQSNREDQLSKIHGMITCVLSLCKRVRRKPEL